MKVLKGFFLSVIIFILALVLVFLQIHMTFNKTFFSTNYFNDSFDKNNMSTSLKDMFFYKINNTSLTTDDFRDQTTQDSYEISIPSLNVGKKILKSAENEWFEIQLSNLAKGTYSYIMSTSDELPTIEIESLKDNVYNDLKEELLTHEKIQSNLEVIHNLFAVLDDKHQAEIIDGNINNELIDKIMSINLVNENNLDRQTIRLIVDVYKSYKHEEIKNIDKEIISKIIKTNFNFDEIDNELDLNKALTRVFPNDNNPLTSLRTLISSYKYIITRLLVLLILMLVIIIFLTNFNIFSSLNWLASSCIIGGLTTIVFGLLGFFPLITKALYYNILSIIDIEDKIESVSNIEQWIEGFIDKFFTTLIIQGSFLVILSIIIFITVSIVSAYNIKTKSVTENDLDENEVDEADSKAVSKSKPKMLIVGMTVLRTAIIIILLTLIPFIVRWGVNDFIVSINDFSSNIENSSVIFKNIDLTKLIPDMIIEK